MKKFFSFLLILMGLSIVFTACKDDEIALMSLDEGRGSELDGETTTPGALQRGEDGLWRATERVPLVGIGRIVDNISQGLVAVAASQDGFNNIVDLNLDNSASLSGLNAKLLGDQILSVRDIYRTYAGGQKVGFVMSANDGGVLKLEVLKLFVISLYKNGTLVKSYNASDDGKTLSLNLLSIGNTGTQALTVEVGENYAFDEIMLATTGVVSADLGKVKIHYAFVGETPIHEITTQDTPVPTVYKDDVKWGKVEEILDPDDSDGCTLYSGLAFLNREAGIDLNYSIPVGTEIGFIYQQGELLNLGLFNEISVTTYDANNKSIDEFSTNSLLGLSAIGGGKGAYSLIATKEGGEKVVIKKTGVGIDAGAFQLLRAFTRKAVAIDPTSYFTTSEQITTPYSSYKFAKPESGELSLRCDDKDPSVVVNGNIVTGMKPGKEYNIVVTYSGPDKRSFTVPVKLKCEERPDYTCVPNYLNKSDWKIAQNNDFVGIDIITVMGDTDNILDSDYSSNYAYSTTVINVLQHGVIVGVKSDSKSINSENKKIRVGFTIQNGSELLGLNALKFFTIKLYNNGTEVESNVSTSNQGVSLGLLNGSRDKLRISIETENEFDCVALCTAGLLGVSLNTLRIYNVFYEDVSDVCDGGDDTFDACSEIMTPINNNLRINYDWTKFSTTATVASSFNNLGNILDDDEENYAFVPVSVQAIGEFSIGFQFDEKKAGQWIGLMLKRPSGLADAAVLGMLEFQIMKGDQVVQTISDDQKGLLGLELLGYGEKAYLEACPQYDYDGLRVKVFSLATVLEDYMFYGLYSMADADGNGIPDCSEGGEEGTTDVIYPDKYKYDICKSEPLIMDFTGGTTGKEYTFTFTKQSDNSSVGEVKIAMPANRRVTIAYSDINLSVGEYYLSITAEGVTQDYPSNIIVNVHPKTSKWIGQSTDWNNSANWTEGIPWTCTDVLIPSGCTHYPVLESGKDYYCNRIQFEPGAEVINTHYLNYEQAWVNVSLKSGEYNMFSAPLKETYTGDMFFSTFKGTDYNTTDYAGCWLDYAETTYPANRFEPKVYQRLWNASVQNAQNDDGGYVAVNPEDNFWTTPFNLVSQEYKAGQGVLVRPDKEGEKTQQSYTFCFPKRHAKYEYYNYAETGAGSPTGRWETISRNSADVGRFIYEDDSRSVSFPYHVTLENKRPTTMFLAGNPFVAHINVKKFLEANPAVKKVKLINKNGNSYNYTEWDRNSTDKQIAPTQAFLVEVAEAYQSLYRYKLDIHFTEDMLELGK